MNIFPSVASSSDRMEESSETGAISTEIESQNGENDCECFTLSWRRTRRENQQKGEWMRKRRREKTARRTGDRRGRGTKMDIRGTEKDGQSAGERERERRNAFLGELIPGVWNGWQCHGSMPSTFLYALRDRVRSRMYVPSNDGTEESSVPTYYRLQSIRRFLISRNSAVNGS